MRRWRWLALVVGALAVLASASAARTGHQVGRAEAIQSTLSALRVHSRSGAEIVFGLRGAVPAGTVVRDGGPAGPAPGGRAGRSSTRVVARTKGRAWFFYEDLAPFREYAHAGRVVLVDVASGRLTVTGRLSWPPTLDGRLPVFLASQTAYLSSRYRVFYRPYAGAAALASQLSSRMSAPGVRLVGAALDPAGGAQVAALLASEQACVVRLSDTVAGGYYAFAQITQSRAALAFRFSQLANFATGFQSFIYSRSSGVSPSAFVASLISSHGCRDVMLFMAGGGYPGAGAVNVGMGINVSDPMHQDVSAAALRGLAAANPGVDFELVLDAPYAAAFEALEGIGNVLLVAAPLAPGGGSFTYLPEARVGGRLVANDTNPLHILQLTDRLVYGLDRVIDTPAEVAQLQTLDDAGKLPSVLAYIVARAFALGAPVDFVARSGLGSAPSVHFHGFTAGPPSGGGGPVPPVVTARPDSYTVAFPGPLSVSAANGVLANDSDSAGNALRVDQLNGTGLAPPLQGTSTKGAAVKLGEDGSFTYDPAGAAALQGLSHGQSVTDTFTYRATDRRGGFATATVTITVTGANHPPVANPDSYTADNNAVLNENAGSGVLANDTDLDTDTLSVDQLNGTGGTPPFTGTSAKGAGVTLRADGSFSYDPSGSAALQAIPRGQTTTDTFTYRANDGHGGTATATVTITVTGAVNHPPVAQADAYTAANNTPLNQNAGGGVLANDTDLDGDTLSVDQLNGTGGTPPFIGTSSKGAAVTLNADGSFSYDPSGSATLQALPRGQTTTDTFTYRANDGHGGTATATVTITVTGAVNHPPVANPDSYAANNNAVLTQGAGSGVLANDTDSDGDVLSVDQLNGTGGTPPFTGTSSKGAAVTLNADGSFSYDPTGSATLQALPRGQTTTDTFTYRANDGHGGTATATVTITVTGALNHPPVANPDSYTANNNAVLTQGAGSGVLANDTDPDGDALAVDQLGGAGGTPPLTGTSAKGATVTLNADGSFSYDPTGSATLAALPRGQTTTDTFTYRANDSHGGTATATVTITVVGTVNHPPVANPDSYAVNNNAVLTVSPRSAGVLANDTDVDGDTLSVDQLNGTGGAAPFSGTSAKGAVVTLNADGTFSYDPTGSATLQAIPRGQTTTDTFTYRANDAHGGTATATVTITVTGALNHPPVATADSYATNNNAALVENAAGGVLANDTDVDGDTLTVDQLDGVGGTAPFTATTAKGAIITLNADGSFSYDPTGSATLQALPRGQTTTDTFTYRANDGHGGTATATVTITVTGAVNHPPVANADAYTANNNAVLTQGAASGVLANDTDPDSDVLSVDQLNGTGGTAPFTATTGKGATITLNADGSFSYDPTASATLQALPRGQTTTDTFTYRASDGHGGTSTATVTITVVGVLNHPPVANPDSYAVNNNVVLTVSPRSAGVLANDTDLDGDTLSVDRLNGTGGAAPFTGTSSKGAAVTMNADGTFSYDPTRAAQLHPPSLTIGQSTTDTFTYEVNDGHGGTATGTVTVTVTAVDTPPTANNFTVATNVVGNTLIEVGTQPSPSSEPKTTDPTNLAAHSSDPDIPFGDSLTFSAAATSTHSGTVTVTNASTGAFTYRPAPGFTGTDTFTYTATDSFGKTATGQVTLNVSGMVWYVQNNASGAHDGRSGSPFNTLASAESATGSAAGDFIYVFKGDGTTTGQNSGITLKNNQTLLSEKYALVVGGQTLTAGNPANRPAIGNSAGSGVTLASGDTVKGFDITGTGASAFAIAGGTGDASGTIADDVLHGASGAGGLTLNGTSGTWAISDLTATGTGGAAFNANAAGTINFTGTNSLTGTGAGAFKNAGGTTYSGTISTASSSGGAANGIDVSGAAGSLTFNGGTLSGTTSNAILASGGTANVTVAGTETNTAGHSVNVTGRTGGTLTISSSVNDTGTGITLTSNAGAATAFTGTLTVSTGANSAFTATGGGTVTATGTGSTLTTTTATALNVASTTIGASGLTFQAISSNGANPGISLSSTGSLGGLSVTGTGSAGSGGTIQNSAGEGINLSSTSSPSFTDMVIENNAADGINGSQVNGLTLAGSTVSGNGTPANQSGENNDGWTSHRAAAPAPPTA
ncbi:MAG: cadherin-like domain-containing protein [Solirubrobacterales bacterium]|nr:cadherin-like domain-containing protein [Solirubrobacterales bacterium]